MKIFSTRAMRACATSTNRKAGVSPYMGSGAGHSIRTKGLGGFTLVETAIAVLLASIMLLALYASFTCGYSMMRVAREDTRATQIMLQKMEATRLLSYDQLSKYPTNSTVYFDEQDKSSGNGGAAYSVSFTAGAAPNTLPAYERTNMMLITVAATWNSGRMPRTRTMQTYVAKYGVQRYVVGN